MKLESILKKSFARNRDKYFYPLSDVGIRNSDFIKGIKVILSKKVTMSKKTQEFEKIFKDKFKHTNSLMLNSGSSANLLALQCLINPYRKKRLMPGDEVIIPALCWSTSLWPIVQSGLKPVFVDIDKDTLNISLSDLLSKISKKTKAIMLIHVLGNSTNMTELIKIIKQKKLILIEDTCESLGSKYKNKYLGTFGEFSTFSFYYSHQITSIEGGMLCCKSKEDADIVKALRSHGWARNLKNQKKIEKINKKINKKFLFYNSGYNLRPTDVQAAIGISQFKSLDHFIKQRNHNRKVIINSLLKDRRWDNQVNFLKENKNVEPSWFGLTMIMNQRFKLKKDKILSILDKNGIENRPIISGNFTLQPAAKKYKLIKNKQKFPNVNIAHDLGFFIGLKIKQINSRELSKFKNIFFRSFAVN